MSNHVVSVLGIALAAMTFGCSGGSEPAVAVPSVQLVRLAEGQSQPRVVVADGVIHLLTYGGDASGGDLSYSRSDDGTKTFNESIRVNSQDGSAISAGTIRGGQMAVDGDGRVHVAWNGSSSAEPKGSLNPEQPADSSYNGTPFLYSRLGGSGEFTPQRNLMGKTFALDGGGTIAADREGNVYAAWHGSAPDSAPAEAGRQVWLERSVDGGATFAEERAISDPAQGACGCCSSHLFAGDGGHVGVFYRTAREIEHRDGFLLTSADYGETFEGTMLQPWTISACPMSSASFSQGPAGLLVAWETAGQVSFVPVDLSSGEALGKPVAAPGEAATRKHPSLAQNSEGETLLVWTEVAGWGKGGSVYWQLFDAEGNELPESGSAAGIPAWSFGTAVALADDSFAVLY
jgi:hypothetical protein